MTRPRDPRSVVVQVRSADKWISRIAATTVAGLVGIADALSYSHMRQLAQDHGQAGWHAHAFPLSVDCIEIVASLVLLADRRAGRRSGWLPWTALAAGTVGSLAANIATAHPDPVSRIIAGWPALALLLAVKLLIGILERPDIPGAVGAVADQASEAIAPALTAIRVSHTRPTDPLELPAQPHRAKIRPRPAEIQDTRPSSSSPSAGPSLDNRAAAPLPAAQTARDELRKAGIPLTRDTLAARLRQHCNPIRNANLTPLLRQLPHEQPTNLAG
jgi:hypothetical protein